MLSCSVIIESNGIFEYFETNVATVNKTVWEMFGLHMISGARRGFVGKIVANIAMVFPILQISSNKLIQLAWVSHLSYNEDSHERSKWTWTIGDALWTCGYLNWSCC